MKPEFLVCDEAVADLDVSIQAQVLNLLMDHPYTHALLTEVPRIDRKRRTFVPIKGEIPSPLAPPSGCHFHPRCPHAMPRCSSEVPALREIAPARWSACHLNDVRSGYLQ